MRKMIPDQSRVIQERAAPPNQYSIVLLVRRLVNAATNGMPI
jgi:hypothetical protein